MRKGHLRLRDREYLVSSSHWQQQQHLMGELVCAACKEDIVGRAMKAKDNCYHEHHFVCCHAGCGINLVKLPVYTR